MSLAFAFGKVENFNQQYLIDADIWVLAASA